MYNITNATINQPENNLGVFAVGGFYDQDNLDLYWSHYAPWVPNGTHPKLQSINKAPVPAGGDAAGLESTLDLDLSFALLYPQEVTLYQTLPTQIQNEVWINEDGPATNGSSSTAELFLPFIAALDGRLCTHREKESGADCGTIELTNVLSVSYGGSELLTPERAANGTCKEFMKLALKGHTLLFASQDHGVAQRPPIALAPDSPLVPRTNGCKSRLCAPSHVTLILALNETTRYQPK